MYILTRVNLLYPLCSEIPCTRHALLFYVRDVTRIESSLRNQTRLNITVLFDLKCCFLSTSSDELPNIEPYM